MLKIKKNTLSCLAMVLLAGSAFAQTPFVIKGQLSPTINEKKIILSYKKNGVNIEDSTIVKMGNFTFKGTINDPAYARLSVDPPAMITMQNAKDLDNRDFFIDGGNIIINSDKGVKPATIKGGKTEADLQKRFDLYKPIQKKVDSLNLVIEAFKTSGNNEGIEKARNEMNAEYAKTAKIDSNFIKENPGSFLSLDLWRSKHRGTLRLNFEPEFNKFSTALKNSYTGKEIQAKFDVAKRIAPGQMAPEFVLKDTLGKDVSLSSFKGKNVFVCFYSTDFMNYESFTFNLGRINRALKDKNTVMITVYYNYINKPDSYWKETIAKSNFNWLNLSDMNGVDNSGSVSATAKAYGLTYNTLPTALLIGTDGKILASQLRLIDTGLAGELAQLIK